MLDSILSKSLAAAVTPKEFLVCMGASLLLGAGLAWIHLYKNRATRNFILTLFLLPVMVQTVIMLVNGNLGTGVAVMGAFSLVRFRSAPGNAREISSIFLAMALGLATGMGYLSVALILLAVSGGIVILTEKLPLDKRISGERELKVTIPENLDYQGIFDDLFCQYTEQAELVRVRTVNMGSLYELQYRVCLRDERVEKEVLGSDSLS